MTQFQTDDARFAGWRYRHDPTHVVFYRAETLRFVARRLGWQIDIPRAGVAMMRKPVGQEASTRATRVTGDEHQRA